MNVLKGIGAIVAGIIFIVATHTGSRATALSRRRFGTQPTLNHDVHTVLVD